MGQAEPENQDLFRRHEQRGVDPGLDRPLRLPHAGLPQIQSQVGRLHAADPTALATQSLSQARFNGTF